MKLSLARTDSAGTKRLAVEAILLGIGARKNRANTCRCQLGSLFVGARASDLFATLLLGDRIDFDACVLLAMSLASVIALPAVELLDKNLVTFLRANHLGGDFSA